MSCKLLLPALGLATVFASASGSRREVAPPGSLVGITVPSKVALVSPEQAGKLVELAVQAGDKVTEETVVFRLNATLEQLEVERLRRLADSDLFERRARVSLQHCQQQAARMRDLREKDIRSEHDVQKYEHELALAELALEQATLDKKQSHNQLAQAEERLAQRSVHSPFAGVVTARYKQAGEAVEKFVPVVEVMCLDPLWIEFECPIQQQQEFRVGTRVLVAPARRPTDTRIATVTFLSPKANASSHSFMVRASIANPDHDWKTGLKMLIEPAPAYDPSAPSGK
jgi:RND family efflux transporter MFP subunit